jgi:hypothetical protein
LVNPLWWGLFGKQAASSNKPLQLQLSLKQLLQPQQQQQLLLPLLFSLLLVQVWPSVQQQAATA